MATVGDRILQRRLALGLTQHELSPGDGVCAAYVGALEQGRRHPSVKALRKLAPRLGVSVHWLETGREDPPEELALLVLDREPSTSPLTDLALAVLQERERSWPTRPRNKPVGARWTTA